MIIDCHNHLGTDLLFYLHGDFPYAQDVPTLERDANYAGVSHFLVFPMVSYAAMDVDALKQGRIELGGNLEKVPYAFENRRMCTELYGYFPAAGARSIPFAMIDPARRVDEQIVELTALCKEYPIAGLKIQATIIRSHIETLGTIGRKFLDFARDNDLPFLIHSSILPSDEWSQCRDILKIVRENPDIRFCIAHSCRFHKPSLDEIAELPNAWFDCSAHRIHCFLAVKDGGSVAIPSERFPSNYEDTGQVLRDLATTYPDKLMWGSDSPFYSYVAKSENGFTHLISSYAEEVADLKSIPQPLFEKVACENTLNFLGRSE